MRDQEGNEIFNWNTNDAQMHKNMSWFSSHRDVLGTPNPFVIAMLEDLMSIGGFAPIEQQCITPFLQEYLSAEDLTSKASVELGGSV